MSAFVHDHSFMYCLHHTLCTEQKIRDAVCMVLGLRGVTSHPSLPAGLTIEEYQDYHTWDFVHALHVAECYAIKQRYGNTKIVDKTYPKDSFVAMTPYGVIKALDSIRYQCSEGDTYEKRPHKKVLKQAREIQGEIAISLAENTRGYVQADWA